MVIQLFGLVHQVIRIDANAMATNQSGIKFQKVPFGSCGFNHVVGVDAHSVKDDRQFVHQGNVHIALGVFNDLSGFGHLDIRGTVNACRNHQFIDPGNHLKGFFVAARNNFFCIGQGMHFVAGVNAFGRITYLEVGAAR